MNIETKERGGIVKGRTVEHRILCCSTPRIKYLLCSGCDSPVNHLSTRQFLTVTFVCARKKRNRSRNFEVFLPAPCRPKAAREGYIAKKKVNTGKNLKRKKRYENSVQTKARKESKHNNQAQKKNCCTRTQTIDQFSLALSVVYDYDVLKNTRTGPPCPRRLFASDFKFSLCSPNTGKQKITFALVKPQTFRSPPENDPAWKA